MRGSFATTPILSPGLLCCTRAMSCASFPGPRSTSCLHLCAQRESKRFNSKVRLTTNRPVITRRAKLTASKIQVTLNWTSRNARSARWTSADLTPTWHHQKWAWSIRQPRSEPSPRCPTKGPCNSLCPKNLINLTSHASLNSWSSLELSASQV